MVGSNEGDGTTGHFEFSLRLKMRALPLAPIQLKRQTDPPHSLEKRVLFPFLPPSGAGCHKEAQRT